MQHLLDEDVRTADDRSERDEELKDDEAHGRRVATGRVEDERPQLLRLLDVAAVPECPARVDGVRHDEQDRRRNLDRGRRAEPEQETDEEAAHEEGEVALERREVHVQVQPRLATTAVEHRPEPHECHCNRRQEQRRADDRPDRDVLGSLAALDDGDDRDQRLRQRRRHGGEEAADSPLPEPDHAAEPLDRVRDQQRAGEQDGEARRQEDGGAHGAEDEPGMPVVVEGRISPAAASTAASCPSAPLRETSTGDARRSARR